MIIISKNIISNRVFFKDLKVGDCFYINFRYSMKIGDNAGGVDLTTGIISYISGMTRVRSCDKEIN